MCPVRGAIRDRRNSTQERRARYANITDHQNTAWRAISICGEDTNEKSKEH
jgi:hypothetical protein